MKNQPSSIVFYNIWAHRYPGDLQRYLKTNAPTTDIFCLTEVTDYTCEPEQAPQVYTGDPKQEPPALVNGLYLLERCLQKDFQYWYHSPEHKEWQCRVTEKVYSGVGFGSALFYRADLKVVAIGNEPIQFENTRIPPRVMQWIVYEKGGSRYLASHLHGIWIADNTKGDAPERDLQSRKVRWHLKQLSEWFQTKKVIFGGDLNLGLETKALKNLVEGQVGEIGTRYCNLIVEHGIDSTRTKHYRKFREVGASQHADYVITSSQVKVHSFTVENDEPASDHAPLHIVFE